MRRCLFACSLLLVVLGASRRDASAAIIFTADLEDVVAASSHIVVARLDSEQGLVPETWLRGEPTKPAQPIVRIPGVLRRPIQRGRISPGFGSGRAGKPETVDRYLFCLEEKHGRLHPTGYARRRGVGGSHAAVRVFTKEGHVFGFRQMVNPGGPTPVHENPAEVSAFLVHLRALIAKHPYVPPANPVQLPSLPVPERERLLSILDGQLDLYQGDWHTALGGWHGHAPDRKGIETLAVRLQDFARKTESPAAALHAFDAITLLCHKTSEGYPHRPFVRGVAEALVEVLDPKLARAYVIDEIEHGPYGTDFVLLGRVAGQLGPETFEQALASLESWVERQGWNKGVGAFHALRQLGAGKRAAEAERRREVREKGGGR